jgi:hypothetical protein
MRTKRATVAVSAVLASAFALSPLSARAMLAPAPAPAAPAPIAIDKCVVPEYANHDLIDSGLLLGTGGVKIAFHDQVPAKATEVTFRVGYPGNVATVRDVGTFTDNARVVHQYSDTFNESTFAGSRPMTCEVVSARFADGMVWTSPEREAR